MRRAKGAHRDEVVVHVPRVMLWRMHGLWAIAGTGLLGPPPGSTQAELGEVARYVQNRAYRARSNGVVTLDLPRGDAARIGALTRHFASIAVAKARAAGIDDRTFLFAFLGGAVCSAAVIAKRGKRHATAIDQLVMASGSAINVDHRCIEPQSIERKIRRQSARVAKLRQFAAPLPRLRDLLAEAEREIQQQAKASAQKRV